MRFFVLGLLVGVLYSGIEAMFLEERHYRRLDKTLLRSLRCIDDWRRRAPPPEHTPPSRLTWHSWNMAPAAVEISKRRLKMYQRWASKPKYYGQVLAAIFSDAKVDQRLGVARMQDGRVGARSTPWARQMQDDLARMADAVGSHGGRAPHSHL